MGLLIRYRMSTVLNVIKRLSVNIFLFLGVLVCAAAGGLLFYYLENVESQKVQQNLKNSVVDCFKISANTLGISSEAESIYDNCILPHHPVEPWSYIGGFVLAYSTMITTSYNLQLITDGGRLCYIIFCFIGMPLGVMFLANLGKFMEKTVGHIADKLKRCLNVKRKRNNQISPEDGISDDDDTKKEEYEEEFEIGGLLFLALYLLYTACGVLAMSFFDQYDIVDSLYLNFIAMLAMDATNFFSTRNFLLLILSLVYITGGLALITIAISVLGKYLNYLQSIGMKLTGVRMKKVWIGGKQVNINDIINLVADEVGVDRAQLDGLNLDLLLEKKINPKEYESNESNDAKDKEWKWSSFFKFKTKQSDTGHPGLSKTDKKGRKKGRKKKTKQEIQKDKEKMQKEKDEDDFGTFKSAVSELMEEKQFENQELDKIDEIDENQRRTNENTSPISKTEEERVTKNDTNQNAEDYPERQKSKQTIARNNLESPSIISKDEVETMEVGDKRPNINKEKEKKENTSDKIKEDTAKKSSDDTGKTSRNSFESQGKTKPITQKNDMNQKIEDSPERQKSELKLASPSISSKEKLKTTEMDKEKIENRENRIKEETTRKQSEGEISRFSESETDDESEHITFY